MSRKLRVTTDSGAREDFDLIDRNYSGMNDYTYKLMDGCLWVFQGHDTHVFPLVSVRKFEVVDG